MNPEAPPAASLRLRIITLGILWLAGLYLRLPVLVMPPLALSITAELGLNQSQLGALTTIPVLMLSLGALPGSLVVARLGPLLALVLSLVILALASSARGLVPPVFVLFVATVILGFAIAIMQPAFPALVLRWCRGYVALGSAVYMNGMLMGEFIGGGLTLPFIMPWLHESWRLTLLVWSLPGLVVAALLFWSRHIGIAPINVSSSIVSWKPRWKETRVWHLGLVLGAASAGFFGTNAYMGTILKNVGQQDQLAEFLLLFNGTQVVGSVVMVVLAKWLVGKRWPVILMAWGVLLGLVGLMLLEGRLLLTSLFILGFCTCVQLILTVALVPQIAGEDDAAPLAAGMFAIGYFLGFVVPLACGLLADIYANSNLVLAPLVLLAVIASLLAQTSKHIHE